MPTATSGAPASVGVVGLGLIGGSILRGLRAALPGIRLVGVTARPATAAAALAAGACDAAGTDVALLADVEVVVLCTPVDAMDRWLTLLRPLDGVLVTDAGSTKAQVCARGAELLGGRFLGGHPMAGRERSGWGAADPDLFRGATWVLTPVDDAHLARFDGWVTAVRALGAEPLTLDPAEHDAATALISHLPLALSAALVRAVTAAPAWPLGARLAASGLRDTARLAGGDPAMAAAIAVSNRDALLDALDRVAGEIAGLRSLLETDADTAALAAWFAAARDRRATWLADRATAGRPLT